MQQKNIKMESTEKRLKKNIKSEGVTVPERREKSRAINYILKK